MKDHSLYKSVLSFFTACLLFIVTTQAQTVLPVDLRKVLQLAGSNNLTIKEFEARYRLSMAAYTKSREWYLPEVYTGFTTHYLAGAAMNTDGKIFTDLARNNLWSGLGVAAQWDFNKGANAEKVALQQTKAVQYLSQAERNQAILNTVKVYLDWQGEQMRYMVLRTLLQQSDTLNQQIKIQVDAGLRYQSEYLLAQSNYNHYRIELLQSKTDMQKKAAGLIALLNLGEGVSIINTDSMLVPVPLMADISIDTLSATNTIQQHPLYKSLQTGLAAWQLEKKTTTTGLWKPTLRLSTDNGLFGKIATPWYNTYQVNASLIWHLPLGRWIHKGDLSIYNEKIALQEVGISQLKNTLQQQIAVTKSQILETKEQLAIARDALETAAGGLQQSMERQKMGTANPLEVFQAQQFYRQAQLDYIKVVVNYNQAQYDLFVAVGNNF